MSNSDSFIDEVSEEVRRDKLFALMRRYGWIAIVAVLAIVGGAAWSEWSKAQSATRAQALGDALIAAVETGDATGRVAALAAVETDGPAQAVASLLTAAEQESAGDIATAVDTLMAVADDAALPTVYRDLARLKALMIGGDVLEPDMRRAGLETMAVPGEPYRTVAQEQLALELLEEGDSDAAVVALRSLIADAEASDALRARAEELILAIEGAAPGAEDVAEPVPADETVAPEAVTDEDAPQDIIAVDAEAVEPGDLSAQDAPETATPDAAPVPETTEESVTEETATEETATEETVTEETVTEETVTEETVTDETATEETVTDETATGVDAATDGAAPDGADADDQ